MSRPAYLYSEQELADTIAKLKAKGEAAKAKESGGMGSRPPAPTDPETWAKFCAWRMGLAEMPPGLDPRWATWDAERKGLPAPEREPGQEG